MGRRRTSRLNPALAVLRASQVEFSRLGVARAGVFGSTARGLDTDESDVDVMLSLSPEVDATADPIDLIKLEGRVCDAFAAELPGVVVHVSIQQAMRTEVRAEAEAEVVYAY